MARAGGNPKIAEAGKKTRFGESGGYSAVKAQEKSVEARAFNRSLNDDLREQCTDDVIKDMNKRLITMAKHGNLKAYEIIRGGLGENPTEKHEHGFLEHGFDLMERMVAEMEEYE